LDGLESLQPDPAEQAYRGPAIGQGKLATIRPNILERRILGGVAREETKGVL
jgi:hypothetical protein